MVKAGVEVFRLPCPDAEEAVKNEASGDLARRMFLAMLGQVHRGA
jgi:hypothetical protein